MHIGICMYYTLNHCYSSLRLIIILYSYHNTVKTDKLLTSRSDNITLLRLSVCSEEGKKCNTSGHATCHA